MTRRLHMGLSVRGALKNRLFSGFRRDDGTDATAGEVEDWLLDELAKGHEKIPLGNCDKWNWTTGCPGHEEAELPNAEGEGK